MAHSKNPKAEKIMRLRADYLPKNVIIFDQPCELGYHCPKCKYKLIVGGEYDERLEWSEYHGFVWCSVCNKDYPVPLCVPELDRATDLFLDIIQDMKKRV